MACLPPRAIHSPIAIASGMLAASVNAPQPSPFIELTTANPIAATATTRTIKMAAEARAPASGESSSRAISASDRPPWRTLAASITKSCTAPAMTTPQTSHRKPGANPNCTARTGPMSGPAPVMAAKWWPKRTHRCVGT